MTCWRNYLSVSWFVSKTSSDPVWHNISTINTLQRTQNMLTHVELQLEASHIYSSSYTGCKSRKKCTNYQLALVAIMVQTTSAPNYLSCVLQIIIIECDSRAPTFDEHGKERTVHQKK